MSGSCLTESQIVLVDELAFGGARLKEIEHQYDDDHTEHGSA